MGGAANIGFSKITSNFPSSGDYKVKFGLSGNLGLFLEKRIDHTSSFGIEALWVQIEGKEIRENIELNVANIGTVGIASDELSIHASYVGIPIYYQFETGKIGIKGGFQPMLFLFANSENELISMLNNGETTKEESKETGLNFNRLDIGPKVGITYQLNDKCRLSVDYYHGRLDIKKDEFMLERKNRQFSFGVQYYFVQ